MSWRFHCHFGQVCFHNRKPGTSSDSTNQASRFRDYIKHHQTCGEILEVVLSQLPWWSFTTDNHWTSWSPWPWRACGDSFCPLVKMKRKSRCSKWNSLPRSVSSDGTWGRSTAWKHMKTHINSYPSQKMSLEIDDFLQLLPWGSMFVEFGSENLVCGISTSSDPTGPQWPLFASGYWVWVMCQSFFLTGA